MFNPKFTVESFGGGACKGFYLVGYIKAKEELRITDADLGVHTLKEGVSVGTVIQALGEEGISYNLIDEYFRKNENIMKNIFPADLFGILHLHHGINDENGYKLDVTGNYVANSGFAHTSNLEKFLKNFIGNVTFKERQNLEFIAVDRERKRPIYLNYKTCPNLKVLDGCIASSTLPGVFPVKKIEHNGKWKYAIDGGIIENLPIKHALNNEKVKNIFAVTFTGIFPEEKHPDAWWEFLAPSVTLCSAYNEKLFMGKVLQGDYSKKGYIKRRENEEKNVDKIYLDFVTNKEIKEIIYNGRKINLAMLAPQGIDSYAFEPNYKNFQELSKRGYEDSKRVLRKFVNLKEKKFFFFR